MSREDRYERKMDLRERRYISEQLIKRKRSEELEALEEVFDRSTLMRLYRLLNIGRIKRIFGVVKAGKESKVFWAKGVDGNDLAVKIYLTASSEFRRGMMSYIEGDPRFKKVRRDTRSLIYLWAQKEYRNLSTAYQVGVKVPRPILVDGNILVMEFIGEDGEPAPLLKEVEMARPKEVYKEVMRLVAKLYSKAKLVHADLSEYNIMVHHDVPFLIDMSQSVHIKHPSSLLYLRRDVENINRYFRRLGVEVEAAEEVVDRLVRIDG